MVIKCVFHRFATAQCLEDLVFLVRHGRIDLIGNIQASQWANAIDTLRVAQLLVIGKLEV